MKTLNKKENIVLLYLALFVVYFILKITSLSLPFFLSYNFLFAIFFLTTLLKDKKIEQILNILILLFIAYSLVNTLIGFITLFSNSSGLDLIVNIFKSIVTIILGLYLLVNNPLLDKKINLEIPYNILNILELLVLVTLIINSFSASGLINILLSIISSIIYISLKLLIIRYYHIK